MSHPSFTVVPTKFVDRKCCVLQNENCLSPLTFGEATKRAAISWKTTTSTLPDAARVDAPYMRDGQPQGSYPACLPSEFAEFNLLPDVRDVAIALFAAEQIQWHAAINAGPTNHLLSSQVQCVNALGPGLNDPVFVAKAFDGVLPIADVVEVEPQRWLTFEYIGDTDYLHERTGLPRTRGSMTTSADAAIAYRSTTGAKELALIEWKFTEDYTNHKLAAPRGAPRQDRYRRLWEAADNPLRRDVIPYDDMFVEPFYQLMRQQLLAHAIGTSSTNDYDVVRVVHICPSENAGVHGALTRDSHRGAGTDVLEIWSKICGDSDRFISIDSERFLVDGLRSDEYRTRYTWKR